MAVNMKLGIDVGAFKAGIADANAQIKSFDAQLKVAENTIKKYGDGETGLITKTNALTGKLETQRQMVKKYEQALKDMDAHGVNPLTKDYQLMQAAMLNAQADVMETEAALHKLSDSQVEAAQTADKMTQSMNGISKKISLDQVISGINAITTGLGNAALKAVNFGEKLFGVIMDSAARADDISTLATRMDLTTDEVQQMQYVAARFEAPVEAMGKTWEKVKIDISSDSEAIAESFKKLGVATHEMIGSAKYGEQIKGAARNYKDVFWDIGDALMQLTDASEQERLAQQLLGRSWTEWIPLFKAGRKEYEDAVAAAPAASKNAVESSAALADSVEQAISSLNTLKIQLLEKISPALTAGADAIAKLLDSVTAYLKTDEGQEMMTNLGNAVSTLFEDLGNIDPKKVVENFSTLFSGVVDSFQWLSDHWGDVKNALIGIAGGFGVLELATLALNVGKVVSGLKGLINKGGSSAAPSAAPNAAEAGEQIGTWLRLGATSVGQWIGNTARGLSIYDPTGSLALAPQLIEDRTTFGHELANGASIGEAAAKSWETVKASAQEGTDNLKKYFGEQVPNAFWGMFGFKDTADAVKQFTELFTGKDTPDITVHAVAEENAAADLSQQVGEVTIPASLYVRDVSGAELEELIGGGGGSSGGHGFANGLPYVPYDNFLAFLHKGERVIPAREVAASQNYSSNLYVEAMYMNNGMDADGLAARIAATQRRVSSGYGN